MTKKQFPSILLLSLSLSLLHKPNAFLSHLSDIVFGWLLSLLKVSHLLLLSLSFLPQLHALSLSLSLSNKSSSISSISPHRHRLFFHFILLPSPTKFSLSSLIYLWTSLHLILFPSSPSPPNFSSMFRSYSLPPVIHRYSFPPFPVSKKFPSKGTQNPVFYLIWGRIFWWTVFLSYSKTILHLKLDMSQEYGRAQSIWTSSSYYKVSSISRFRFSLNLSLCLSHLFFKVSVYFSLETLCLFVCIIQIWIW